MNQIFWRQKDHSELWKDWSIFVIFLVALWARNLSIYCSNYMKSCFFLWNSWKGGPKYLDQITRNPSRITRFRGIWSLSWVKKINCWTNTVPEISYPMAIDVQMMSDTQAKIVCLYSFVWEVLYNLIKFVVFFFRHFANNGFL